MDFITGKPIYAQIVDTLQVEIIDGKHSAGERLPSVREMASSMGVNPATVLRAYEKLQADGVITMQRGMGYFLVDNAVEKVSEILRAEFFSTTVPQIVATMRKLSISTNELSPIMEEGLKGN